MHSSGLFLITVLIVTLLTILIAFKTPGKAIKYFKTDDGKKVLSGILLFTGLAGALVLWSGNSKAGGGWFGYSEIFLGVDYTQGQSPQCVDYGPDIKATSNGGIRLSVYESDDSAYKLNVKYTHHSCAFSLDKNIYDAIGVESVYRFNF